MTSHYPTHYTIVLGTSFAHCEPKYMRRAVKVYSLYIKTAAVESKLKLLLFLFIFFIDSVLYIPYISLTILLSSLCA